MVDYSRQIQVVLNPDEQNLQQTLNLAAVVHHNYWAYTRECLVVDRP